MERFPRGSLPPSVFERLLRETRPELRRAPRPAGQSPRDVCDLASTCPTCGTLMQPEHAHYRCLTCGYRDSCCF